MKKFISLILAVCLCLTLFSACGKKAKLLGAWQCQLDLSQQMQQLLDAEKLGSDQPLEDFTVTVRLTFSADDTFTLTMEEDALTKAFHKLAESLEKTLMDTLQEKLSEAGLDVALESLLGLSGLSDNSLTEKLRESFEDADFSQQLSELIVLEGYYKISGDKLLLTDDPEEKPDDFYLPYTVEATTLTIDAPVGESAFIGDHPLFSAPVTFTRTL